MTFGDFSRSYPSSVDDDEVARLNRVELDEALPAGRLMKRVVGGSTP